MTKRKRKKYNQWIVVGVLIVVVFSLYYFANSSLSITEGISCNLGSWNYLNYDSATNVMKIIINGEIQASGGCFGTYQVARRGIETDKETCQKIGFNWNDVPNSDGYNCWLTNENWFAGKSYTSDITCTHSACPSCEPQKVNPSFNGLSVTFDGMDQTNDDAVICSGTLSITSPSNAIPETSPGKSDIFSILVILSIVGGIGYIGYRIYKK